MEVRTLKVEEAVDEIVSSDPATGREIGRVGVASSEEVSRALSAARGAQGDWAKLTFDERGQVVMRARAIVLDEIEGIAALISKESGKPVDEAIAMEIVPTLD